jgi:nucleoside-diphosphate-sugar epimerase
MLLLTGGNGFIGRHLAARLIALGRRFEILVRSRHHLELFERHGIRIHVGELADVPTLREACRGARAVIHLAAATDVSDAALNRRDNEDGVRHLIAALAGSPVERVLHFSTSCAGRERRDAYGETKLRAESLLAASGVPTVMFRPTMVYGRGSREFETFLAAVRRLPVVPVVGSGRNLLQPVCIHDVVDAALAALDSSAAIGKTYDIAGPRPVPFDELVQATARALGKRRVVAPFPVWLGMAAARALGKAMAHPPLTIDQVLAFTQDTRADLGPARADLGFAPRELDAGLRAILGAAPATGGPS